MTSAPTPVARHRGPPHRLALVLLATLAVVLGVGFVLLGHGSGGNVTTAIEGSGVPASEARSLPAFDGLDLTGANRVTVTIGATQSVVVHADDNLFAHVTTDVRDGTLVVDNRESVRTNSPMSVEIVVPSLHTVTLTGSGAIDVSGIDTDTLAVNLVGSGLITASGRVDSLHAHLGGSGDCQLQSLAAGDVIAEIAGSGRISVQAVHALDAVVAGTGTIAYTGSPAQVTKSVTGTGAVVEQ